MVNLKKLCVKKDKEIVGLPTVSIAIYFDKFAHEISKQIAQAINKYVSFVGFENLKQYVANNGYFRALTKTKFKRDIALLQDYPVDLVGISLEYNSREDGLPGPYGVYVFLRDEALDTFPLQANMLRLDFDCSVINLNNVEDFVLFYQELLQELPFQSSNAGYSFKRVEALENIATPGVSRKIRRYYGFDPGYESVRYDMKNSVFSAHWLNGIDDILVDKIGGIESIKNKMTSTQLIEIPNGIILRGAKMPPVGDINHNAPDIGSLPEISRVLKPLRIEFEMFDGWLARFDEMDNRPWV